MNPSPDHLTAEATLLERLANCVSLLPDKQELLEQAEALRRRAAVMEGIEALARRAQDDPDLHPAFP